MSEGELGTSRRQNEKMGIGEACERFIAEVLTPRFLPEIRPPTEFNYPVAIYGKWHGNKYRFITRYRSDDPRSYTPKFDAPFARLEYVNRDKFDLSWHRHTGEWFRLFESLPADGGASSDQKRTIFPAVLTGSGFDAGQSLDGSTLTVTVGRSLIRVGNSRMTAWLNPGPGRLDRFLLYET